MVTWGGAKGRIWKGLREDQTLIMQCLGTDTQQKKLIFPLPLFKCVLPLNIYFNKMFLNGKINCVTVLIKEVPSLALINDLEHVK